MLVRYYSVFVTKEHLNSTNPIKAAIQDKYPQGIVLIKEGGIAVEFPNTVLTFGLDDDALMLQSMLTTTVKTKVETPTEVHIWRAFRTPPKSETYDENGELITENIEETQAA